MNYFQGAIRELKAITWPTEKETFRLTKITIVFVALFTFMFFVTDFVLSGVFTTLYNIL